ncbi:MAG: hypothetical protein ACJ8KO_11565 [Sulfurifustaceae bacterium]
MLVTAQALASLPILVIATAVTGVASALGYRGTEIAPGERRAEVISTCPATSAFGTGGWRRYRLFGVRSDNGDLVLRRRYHLPRARRAAPERGKRRIPF